jgi:N-terminal domain of BNR-repeat neuraminidase/Fibronectin type III domain
MKKIYLLSINLLFVYFIKAQTVASYNFLQSTNVYTQITGGTSYGMGVNDAVYGGTANLIPFPFVYKGTTYTTFYVSTNGFITLGNATTPAITNYTPLSNASAASNNVISAFGANLRSDVRYEVVGTSPNRVAVIQWNNTTTILGFDPDALKFQIRLSETTHAINIVYGNLFIDAANLTNGQIGLRGASNTDFNCCGFISNSITTNNWDNIISANVNTATLELTQFLFPLPGKTFTYLPSTCAQPTVDATATAITNNSFTLGWINSATYASGYKLRWRKATDLPTISTWATATTIAAGSSSYTFTGLAGNTHYVYSVEGLCSASSSSNVSPITTGNSTNARGLVKTLVNPMTYVSSTISQPTQTTISAGSINQELLRIDVTVNGNVSPLSISQLDFNTTGTTLPANISNAKVYYTGTSATFATTTAFGGAFANPSGNFSISGSQVLTGTVANTTNYFWLAVDIPCGGANGNFIDAECTAIKIGATQIPTVTAPSGARPIGTFDPIYVIQPSTTVVAIGSVENPVLQIPISATTCSADFTQFDFTNPSTNVASTINAKLFYTTTSTFSNAVQFGSTIATPGATFTISGTQASATSGTNYFWLVYDVACNATIGNVIDASCTRVYFTSGTAIILPVAYSNPFGTRAISAATTFSTIADGEWSSPTTWACGLVPTNTTKPVNIKHHITVSDMGNISGNVTVITGKSLTINIGGSLTIGN